MENDKVIDRIKLILKEIEMGEKINSCLREELSYVIETYLVSDNNKREE